MKIEVEDLRLGDRVRVAQKLFRHGQAHPTESGWQKIWTPTPWLVREYEQEGIVVGTRVKQNGYVTWGWEEEPNRWTLESTITAVLVACDLRRAPILVLPEHLERVEQ